jgi:hypothetical protein
MHNQAVGVNRSPCERGGLELERAVMAHHSASFGLTLRVRLDDRPGSFADLARAIADAGDGIRAMRRAHEPAEELR